ncbi:hypothetical protein GON26_06525 [Flavobacterium sp. GA093]|uniref:Uncharacterized protein n=1 Tax=Flavobacterium hydrocarbonoxydans TaxID=2683249 RepID=A0A6I4NHI8_9FLAO|nr:hypothetical protein [Flavobacterium hydrocarbonoxydans]MWB94010.1 hypothetical protein [Flavobacterium hydrocarbonoxydans]
MGRYANYPSTIEDCLCLSIKKLKEWDYLTYNGTKSGTVSWSRNGVPYSNIGISVTKNDFEIYIILDYKTDGEPRNYKVKIISTPSNLGKGEILYFVCPNTKKQCRKLYLHSGYFLHREAFNGLMYSKQIESKKNRDLSKIFDACYLSDDVYEERFKKYFKTHYNGKETKRFKRLNNKILKADSFPVGTIEKLFMM